ncbi:MAG: hypothetical protein ACOYB4_04860, partial [Methyloceanibacter sp.]
RSEKNDGNDNEWEETHDEKADWTEDHGSPQCERNQEARAQNWPGHAQDSPHHAPDRAQDRAHGTTGRAQDGAHGTTGREEDSAHHTPDRAQNWARHAQDGRHGTADGA